QARTARHGAEQLDAGPRHRGQAQVRTHHQHGHHGAKAARGKISPRSTPRKPRRAGRRHRPRPEQRPGAGARRRRSLALDATARAARHRGAAPGRYLCLSVNDTGVGIPQEQLTKIFQPFFTTKAAGHGTGLGLSTSLTIVKNHGGFMTVQSAAGHGTEFKVYLPAIEPPGAPEPTPSAAALPAGNGEGVLIVDDEAAILALSKTT